MDLHGENSFKSRTYQNATFRIQRLEEPLEELSPEEVEMLDGIGKSISAKISELLDTGTIQELEKITANTPPGVIDVMNIKGLGPKKVAVLWKELGIESVGELLYACNENRLVELKGFGIKTQNLVKHAIEYKRSNEGKFHFATAWALANQLTEDLRSESVTKQFSLTGDIRRHSEVLEQIELVVEPSDVNALKEFFSAHPLTNEVTQQNDSLQVATAQGIPVIVWLATSDNYAQLLFNTTGNAAHTAHFDATKISAAHDEKEIYQAHGYDFVPPELREGLTELDKAAAHTLPKLVNLSDLKGILHNHSTYSDGMHTLKEMAEYCRELGYQYLGICDHSQAAFYANGLTPERVVQQHEEIDVINKSMAPFRIFKGIESDILNDGSLDYNEEVISSFEFVVASVHSVLKMDEARATARLIKAIENPHTTILGHPTGRLLLAREGYPIDYKKVIDACADNHVVIEHNANPWRLDLDWRWIDYALNKGVMISINPDAHHRDGYHDMFFGVCAARKGGLTAGMTYNALSLDEISAKFAAKAKGVAAG